MLNIAILADREAWCFSARARALRQYAPPDIQISVIPSDQVYAGYIAWQSYDLVFLLNTAVIDNLRRHFRLCGIDVPIIASHNSGLFRRNEMLRKALDNAEYVIINNYAAYADLLTSTHNRANFCNISNGVDLTTFYPTVPIEDRPHKFLWAGSKEKWDDPGDVKGARRVLAPLKSYLDENQWRLIVGLPWRDPCISLEYLIVDPKGPAKDAAGMREFYNSGSYILCPSLSEGTPNIVLEAMACGCWPVCGPVGNLPELYPGYDWAMPRTSTATVEGVPLATAQDYWETMLAVKDRREEMSAAAVRAVQGWDWSQRAGYFYDLFRRVAGGACPRPFSWLDSHTVASPAA